MNGVLCKNFFPIHILVSWRTLPLFSSSRFSLCVYIRFCFRSLTHLELLLCKVMDMSFLRLFWIRFHMAHYTSKSHYIAEASLESLIFLLPQVSFCANYLQDNGILNRAIFGYLYEKKNKTDWFSDDNRFRRCICYKNGTVFVNFNQIFLVSAMLSRESKIMID